MTDTPSPALPELLTVAQVSEQTSIGRSTLYKLIESGDLFSVRIGGLRRIPRQALLDFIDQATAATREGR